MKCVRIERPGMGSYIQPLDEIHNAIDGEFDSAEPGEKLVLEYLEMPEEEYNELPEFAGW